MVPGSGRTEVLWKSAAHCVGAPWRRMHTEQSHKLAAMGSCDTSNCTRLQKHAAMYKGSNAPLPPVLPCEYGG